MNIFNKIITTLKSWVGIKPEPTFASEVKNLEERVKNIEAVPQKNTDILVPKKKNLIEKIVKSPVKFVPLDKEKQKVIDEKVKETLQVSDFAKNLREPQEKLEEPLTEKPLVTKKKKYYRKPKTVNK